MSKAIIKNEKDWHDYAAGGGSAIVNIMCTFPAHKIMIRQQVDGVPLLTAFRQLKKEGLLKLYRGVGPPLIQKGAGLSVMFGSYHSLQKKLYERYPHISTMKLNLVASFLAGSIEALLTPFERMQTLLAISEHKDYVRVQNTIHTILKIRKHHTYKEYYRGFTAVLLRNGPSTALFFLLREPIKQSLPDVHSGFQNVIEDFVSGAVLGASISTMTYPLNVVKSNMQKHLGTEFKSIYRTFLEVYNLRNRSIRQLYFGVSLNFTRSLISWGIINASYEFFMKYLQNQEE